MSDSDILSNPSQYSDNTSFILEWLQTPGTTTTTTLPPRDYVLETLASHGDPREMLLLIPSQSSFPPEDACYLLQASMLRIAKSGRGVEGNIEYFTSALGAILSKHGDLQDGSCMVHVQDGVIDDGYSATLKTAHLNARCTLTILGRLQELFPVLHTIQKSTNSEKLKQQIAALLFVALKHCVCGSQFIAPENSSSMKKMKARKTTRGAGAIDPTGPNGVGYAELDTDTISQLSTLYDTFATQIYSMFTVQYIMLACKRQTKFNLAVGIEKRDRLGIAPDAEISSSDEDYINSDNEDIDEYMKGRFVGWDYGGVAAYLRWASVNRHIPVVISPLHIVLLSTPYFDVLSSTNSLNAKYVVLDFFERQLRLIPKYSVCMADDLMDKDGATSKDTAEDATAAANSHLTTSSESFEKAFQTVQIVTGLMATTPFEFHRMQAYEVCLLFVNMFAENNRYKFITSFVEMCPYATVASVIVSSLHAEITAEYRILEESSSTSVKPSPFVSSQLIQFLHKMVKKCSGDVEKNKEVIVSLLNLYRFVLMYDKPRKILKINTPEEYAAFRSGPLKTLQDAIGKLSKDVQESLDFNILNFTIADVADHVKA
eukprot:PhF_6_TR40826/c0_g1_i2/m.61783